MCVYEKSRAAVGGNPAKFSRKNELKGINGLRSEVEDGESCCAMREKANW